MNLEGKVGNNKMVVTKPIETKAIKMKSIYLMSEKTNAALKRDAPITEAERLDYKKVQEFVEKNRETLFKNATRIKINVLTDIGWRGHQFFGKDEDIIWYDSAIQYADDDGVIENILMVQILFL